MEKKEYGNDYSNMITIIDSFDAMTSQRGYNCPKNILEALEEVLKCSEPNMNGYTQFKDKEMCERFVLYNIQELGKMGYDAKAMYDDIVVGKEIVNEKAQKSDDEKWKFAASASLKAVNGILKICEDNESEIAIENSPTKEVSDLGYSLDENARLVYADKTLKHDYNIRLNSEFEFQVKKMYDDDKNPEKYAKFNEAKNIKELIDIYLKDDGADSIEKSGLWTKALAITKSADENGKKLLKIGRESKRKQEVTNEPKENEVNEQGIDLGQEIKSAAEKDTGFNMENAKSFEKSIQETILDKNQDKSMNLEDKEDTRE